MSFQFSLDNLKRSRRVTQYSLDGFCERHSDLYEQAPKQFSYVEPGIFGELEDDDLRAALVDLKHRHKTAPNVSQKKALADQIIAAEQESDRRAWRGEYEEPDEENPPLSDPSNEQFSFDPVQFRSEAEEIAREASEKGPLPGPNYGAKRRGKRSVKERWLPPKYPGEKKVTTAEHESKGNELGYLVGGAAMVPLGVLGGVGAGVTAKVVYDHYGKQPGSMRKASSRETTQRMRDARRRGMLAAPVDEAPDLEGLPPIPDVEQVQAYKTTSSGVTGLTPEGAALHKLPYTQPVTEAPMIVTDQNRTQITNDAFDALDESLDYAITPHAQSKLDLVGEQLEDAINTNDSHMLADAYEQAVKTRDLIASGAKGYTMRRR